MSLPGSTAKLSEGSGLSVGKVPGFRGLGLRVNPKPWPYARNP